MRDQFYDGETLGSLPQAKERDPLKAGGRTVGTLLLSLVFQMVVQAGSARGAAAPKLTEQETRDAYAIYSMLLKQLASRRYHQIVGIGQETVKPGSAGEPSPLWPEPAPDQRKTYEPLIEDFKRGNAQPFVLARMFDLAEYRLLTPMEVKEIARRHPVVPRPPGTSLPAWTDPSLEAVGGVYFLSAVGFSPNHLRALVYVGTSDGGQCYFLVKQDGKWTIDKDYRGTICSWVA